MTATISFKTSSSVKRMILKFCIWTVMFFLNQFLFFSSPSRPDTYYGRDKLISGRISEVNCTKIRLTLNFPKTKNPPEKMGFLWLRWSRRWWSGRHADFLLNKKTHLKRWTFLWLRWSRRWRSGRHADFLLNKKPTWKDGLFCGSGGRTRTYDTRINSPLL